MRPPGPTTDENHPQLLNASSLHGELDVPEARRRRTTGPHAPDLQALAGRGRASVRPIDGRTSATAGLQRVEVRGIEPHQPFEMGGVPVAG
jgi:hypothetical protein